MDWKTCRLDFQQKTSFLFGLKKLHFGADKGEAGSYPLTLINAGSAAMLGVGSASVLSRAIGKKDENTIKKIMGNLVAMVLLLSVIYTVVGMVFTRQLLSLTGASDNILNYAEKYLRIVFAGSLFVNFFQSANMVIRGEGQLKRAMTIIASGAILNIILDPIFISILNPYGMGMVSPLEPI